jgi:3-phenylpropionate/trans-cinnamate dioxygenase ferredoxin component
MNAPMREVEVPPAFRPEPGERCLWLIAGRSIALFNVSGELFAIDDSCPHAGASLANGLVSGRTVQCRAHGLRFDMTTGCMTPPGLRVRTYPLSIHGDRVVLTLDAEQGAASSC